MKITRLENCDKHQVQMEGVKGALLEPGGYTPLHAHDAEHLNYVLQGRGQIMSDEGPRAISPGDFILVKPQERHQYRNTSDGPLVFMCMVPSDYE